MMEKMTSREDEDQQQLTILLAECERGDQRARELLAPLVYEELRRIARRKLRGRPIDQTIRTTALIHEAYLKLFGADVEWKNRIHFFAVAARAMRMILVDAARAAHRDKRGGGAVRVTLERHMVAEGPDQALLDVSEALDRLAGQDRRKAVLVELHYFGGLSYAEIAAETGISEATVHRELRMAKAWLKRLLTTAKQDGTMSPATAPE